MAPRQLRTQVLTAKHSTMAVAHSSATCRIHNCNGNYKTTCSNAGHFRMDWLGKLCEIGRKDYVVYVRFGLLNFYNRLGSFGANE